MVLQCCMCVYLDIVHCITIHYFFYAYVYISLHYITYSAYFNYTKMILRCITLYCIDLRYVTLDAYIRYTMCLYIYIYIPYMHTFIHSFIHTYIHLHLHMYTVCSLWLCRPLGAGLVAVRTNGFTGVGTPAGRLVGSEREEDLTVSVGPGSGLFYHVLVIFVVLLRWCGWRLQWWPRRHTIAAFDGHGLTFSHSRWKFCCFTFGELNTEYWILLSFIVDEPICRQRPSQTSMTFIMSSACIWIWKWHQRNFLRDFFAFVVVPRRSSMWTTELWDGLMTCTGHPGTGRKTSGADEHCMTGRRQRRLHRQGPTCFERQRKQILANEGKDMCNDFQCAYNTETYGFHWISFFEHLWRSFWVIRNHSHRHGGGQETFERRAEKSSRPLSCFCVPLFWRARMWFAN